MSRTPLVPPPQPPSGVQSASSNYRTLRDYGATQGAPIGALPEVNFAGFSPTEFMSLSESIGQNVGAIRNSLHVLEQKARKIGTHSDGERFRSKLETEQKATNERIEVTTGDLDRLNDVVRHGDKQQKLNVKRLTADFQSIVDAYSKCQSDIASRQRINVLPTAPSTAGPRHDADDATGANSLDSEQRQLLLGQQHVELGAQRERLGRIEQIEDVVLNVNAIMGRLSVMVQEQSVNIDIIDSNVDNTAATLEDGRRQLEQAARQKAKYRKKVLLLLVLAVILGLILTGVIVSSLKP